MREKKTRSKIASLFRLNTNCILHRKLNSILSLAAVDQTWEKQGDDRISFFRVPDAGLGEPWLMKLVNFRQVFRLIYLSWIETVLLFNGDDNDRQRSNDGSEN